MNRPAQRGFTLVELLVGISLLLLTLSFTASFIFAVREKALLQKDSDQLVALLEFARQQSISVHQGYEYQLTLDADNTVRVIPGNTIRRLNPRLVIQTQPHTSSILFEKRTGYLSADQEINLMLGNLRSVITIDTNGLINQGPIE